MNKSTLTMCALCACVTLAQAQSQAQAQSYPNPRAVQDLPASAPNGNQMGDFKSGPDTTLSLRAGALSIASTGSDPIIYSGALPAGIRGPYFLEFRLNSNAPQPMEIFWKTAGSGDFNGANKVKVGETGKSFDGKYRGYLIELPESLVEPLTQIRIDPASGPGESLFEFIRLRSVTGKIYKEWKANN